MASTSPYFVKREKAIKDAFEEFRLQSLEPWVFFNTGHRIDIKSPRGREVHYGGIEFEGSPRAVFWGVFLIPCLEDIIAEQFEFTVREMVLDEYFSETPIAETRSLLASSIAKFLNRMAEIDQNLRGKGQPESVDRRRVDDKTRALDEVIERHHHAAMQKIRHHRPSFWRANQWWIQLLIAALASIPGWIALSFK